jgi:hypothetical protein
VLPVPLAAAIYASLVYMPAAVENRQLRAELERAEAALLADWPSPALAEAEAKRWSEALGQAVSRRVTQQPDWKVKQTLIESGSAAGVNLQIAGSGVQHTETLGGHTYVAMRLSLTASGPVERLQTFIGGLERSLPTIELQDASLRRLDSGYELRLECAVYWEPALSPASQGPSARDMGEPEAAR